MAMATSYLEIPNQKKPKGVTGLTTQGKSGPETIDFLMKYGRFPYFLP